MRPQHHKIHLTDDDRQTLKEITNKGMHNARAIKRAHSLLLVDQGLNDAGLSLRVNYNQQTIHRIRKRFCKYGLGKTIYDKEKPGAPKALDGRDEALLISIACSNPP
ncbi:MAG: hypothetical protein OEZ36_02160 [Spirochaetota bacterium]|nr:hypothetical protein [Spirochaetota bacterium]